MSIFGTYLRLGLASIAAAALAVVGGCVADHYPDEGMSRNSLRMSVTVVVSGSQSTRAGHHDDFEEQGSAAENFIDIDSGDFRLLLFDNKGLYLRDIDLAECDLFNSSTGGTTYYVIECEVDFDEVGDDALAEIRANGLQVVALANWRSVGRQSYSLSNTQLSGLWKNRTDHNFNLYNTSASYTSWRPSLDEKRYIPMFGMSKSSAFAPRTSGEYLSTASISMQRVVAKIEVIDNLTSQQGIDIAGVTMTQFNTVGRLLPDVEANPGWSTAGSQVSTSSLPQDGAPAQNLAFFKEGQKWVAYVPESYLGAPTVDAEGNFNASRPHLEVAVSGVSESGNVDYPVHFGLYNANFKPTVPDDSWNHILRNHIYRFSVNKVGITLNLHLHVLPWEPEDDEMWDFTDNPSLSQELEWDPDTYENSTEEVGTTGKIVLSLESDKILTGQFCFMSPVNARWYARLTFLDGTNPYAVSFCNRDGSIPGVEEGSNAVVHEISGVITSDAAPENIYIRAMSSGGEYESRFRLNFYVENFGSWIEVPMVSGNFPYYTVIRPGNIID